MQAFDPFLLDPPSDDPGARHAALTLGAMVSRVVRDRMAIVARPISVAMLGADHAWLGVQLLAWGCRPVAVIDPSEERIDAGRRLADLLAVDDPDLNFVAEAPERPDGYRWDLALVDAREGMPGVEPSALEGAAEHATRTIVLSDDRRAIRTRLEEAGAPEPALVRPPTDADPRFVRAELALVTTPANEGAPL